MLLFVIPLVLDNLPEPYNQDVLRTESVAIPRELLELFEVQSLLATK